MKCTITWLFFQALTISVTLAQYEEPPWWPLLEATFDGEFSLQRCKKRTAMNNNQKRMGPPSSGEGCARRPKTCFFGLQECSGGVSSYADTMCICNFRTWQCDPVPCPDSTVPLTPVTGGPVTLFGQEWYPGNTTFIFLSNSDVGGTIPAGIEQLTRLTSIDLDGNSLTGAIPTTIGLWTQLRSLDLSRNSLIGTIPTEIGLLTELEVLRLNDNTLQGSIPTEIGLLTRLFELYLSRNFLKGNIPSEIGQLSGLSMLLDLSSNNLGGPIPTDALANLVSGSPDIMLNNNNLSGSIPAMFCSEDTFFGPAPTIDCGEIACDCCQSVDGFSCDAPTDEGSVTLFGQEWYPGNTTFIFLSNSGVGGTIPSGIEQLTRLTSIDIYGNSLTGTIPTTIGLWTQLGSLDLSQNFLIGTIPTEIGLLTELEVLRLNENALRGSIPTEIGLLTRLFDLSLSRNSLEGTIPTEIGQLSGLSMFLDLSSNDLSGPVPTDALVNLFSGSPGITLNDNNLSGSISAAFCAEDIFLSTALTIDCGEIACDCCQSVDGFSCV